MSILVLNTTFSPRSTSMDNFVDYITKNFQQEYIPVFEHKCNPSYLTTDFLPKTNIINNNSSVTWYKHDDYGIVMLVGKMLIFPVNNTGDYMCTRDNKNYRQLDENQILDLVKRIKT